MNCYGFLLTLVPYGSQTYHTKKSNIEFIDPNLLVQQRQIKKQKHWCPDGAVKLQITDGLYTAFKLLPRGFDYFPTIVARTEVTYVMVIIFVSASVFKTSTGEGDLSFETSTYSKLD